MTSWKVDAIDGAGLFELRLAPELNEAVWSIRAEASCCGGAEGTDTREIDEKLVAEKRLGLVSCGSASKT